MGIGESAWVRSPAIEMIFFFGFFARFLCQKNQLFFSKYMLVHHSKLEVAISLSLRKSDVYESKIESQTPSLGAVLVVRVAGCQNRARISGCFFTRDSSRD